MKKPQNLFIKYRKPLAAAVFLIILIISWSKISWLFNFEYSWRYLNNVFSQTGGRKPPTIMAKKSATGAEQTSVTPKQPDKQQTKTDEIAEVKNVPDAVTIPKISINAPIVTTQITDNAAIHSLLDTGVVLYPGSAEFGKMGETILLGHSAPPGWPKIKYDWVFTKISELKAGDLIRITYNNKNYSYTVVKTKILKPGEEIPGGIATANTLALVSCWPPGKDLQRIAVLAVINSK